MSRAEEPIEVPGFTHSVLTMHLIDELGQPTRTALDRTLEFLHEQLDRDASPSP